jgi:hypothetical protein
LATRIKVAGFGGLFLCANQARIYCVRCGHGAPGDASMSKTFLIAASLSFLAAVLTAHATGGRASSPGPLEAKAATP